MPPSRADHVLTFKVTLRGIKPPIWRRVEVTSDASMWDLHVAIQDSMGWLDSHLHEFLQMGPRKLALRVGIPGDDDFDEPPAPGWVVPAVDFFTLAHRKALYTYDFGDNWEHDVTLEGVRPVARTENSDDWPLCNGGRRCCPPEDVGGVQSYEEFVAAATNPLHIDHKEVIVWLGGPFDPEEFDATDVFFTDATARLMSLLRGE